MSYEAKLRYLATIDGAVIWDQANLTLISIQDIVNYSNEELREFGNKILDEKITIGGVNPYATVKLLEFVEEVLGVKRDLFGRFLK